MANQPPPPHDTPAHSQPPAPQPPRQRLRSHKVRRTRISGAWTSVAAFAVVLLLLLIFILQNSHTVDVSYLGAHGHLPLGVTMLLAAVFGVLLIALPGTARIIQLRITAHRHRRADTQLITAAPPQETPAETAPPATQASDSHTPAQQ
jgi:uncharacterized integral membrane protein